MEGLEWEKIKKSKIKLNSIDLEITSGILILGLVIAGSICYECYEKQEQYYAVEIDSDDLIEDESGNISYVFEPGEHVVKVSRNDALKRTIEPVEGYAIKSVEFNGWTCRNEVIYVNDETVTVTATSDENGNYKFDKFGEVSKEKATQKSKKGK